MLLLPSPYSYGMSLARISSACVNGLLVTPVELEVDIKPGLPLFLVVGMAGRPAEEMRSRVTTAIKNSGYKFPLGKITINLLPSAVSKRGTGFDLAVALGILMASQAIPTLSLEPLFLGELSLDGSLKPHTQLLPILLYALTRHSCCVIPGANVNQWEVVPESKVLLANSLREVIEIVRRPMNFQSKQRINPPSLSRNKYLIDQIRGQALPKRVLEIALAGGHHLFLSGPPGSGKTMLAQATIELLPILSREEELELLQVQALVGLEKLEANRPLRSPLPTISHSGLFGGGLVPRPGEMTLAHRGILFLDEFSQMERNVSEALRKPMEDKFIALVRQGQETILPADCLVIAAQNACACGLSGREGEECRCTHSELIRYHKKHSEALLDRFDLFCLVPRINFAEYQESLERKGEDIAASIARVRKLQGTRKQVVSLTGLAYSSQEYLLKAAHKFCFSARGMEKVVRIAQTIADLGDSKHIEIEHIQEALQYRKREVAI